MEIQNKSSDNQLETVLRDFKWDGKGHFGYHGQYMMQSPLALPMFTQLFKQEDFKNVIEIGTGHGGLAIFLQKQANIHNFNFFTYDIREPGNKSSDFSSVKNAILRNVFDPKSIIEIKNTIASGKTLILCDGGAIIREVNTFTPMLNKGDFIMAHDYARSAAYHDEKIKEYWGWCEITDANIPDVLPTIERYEGIDFEKAAWLCAVKTDAVKIDTVEEVAPTISKTSVNYGNLGGWALGAKAFDYLVDNFGGDNMTILELGSGSGTLELSKFFTMYSIENDVNWIKHPPSTTTYIHAPLVNGWFDVNLVKQGIADKTYDILLIDGPPQDNRQNISKHLDMFDSSAIWVFDDSERPPIAALADSHRRRVDGTAVEIHEDSVKSKKCTIVIPNSNRKNFADDDSINARYDLATVEKWDIECARHVTNLVDKTYTYIKGKDNIKVIDIGSNTGKFLELLDKKIEVTRALLVEPEKSLLDFSKDKFKGRDFIYLNKGLYEKPCKMFWAAACETQNNLGISKVTRHANGDEIDLIAFDDLDFKDFEPDVIKIDAEGCDFKIILGMLRFLERLKNKPLIIAETNGYENISPENAVDLIKIQNILKSMGYDFDTVPKHSTDLFFFHPGD